MAKFQENKGMILISGLMVAGVIFAFSGIFMSSSIVQNQAVQRQKESLQSFYAAEKGIEYLFIESLNHGWDFVTHQVAPKDLDGDGKINDLVPNASIPGVILPGVTLSGTSININGEYEVNKSQALVKTYVDPSNTSQVILLSSGTINGVSSPRIIKSRIVRKSMYDYLMFFPFTQALSGGGSYDGKGSGGIHVNGDLILYNDGNMANVTELSTSGYIYYNSSQYSPPYNDDDADGVRDGVVHMFKLPFPPYSYTLPNGNIIYDKSFFFCQGARINGISIPKELPSDWQWDKYRGTDAIDNPGGKAELPVTIEVPPEELNRLAVTNANDYWIKLYGSNPDWVNSEWWEDKVYGNDRQSGIETATVRFTNSQYQPGAWAEFIKNNGLESIVKEKNTGGQYLVPLNVELKYSELARSNGLYVGNDAGGNLEVYMNGVKQDIFPCWIQDNVQFYNAVRPHTVSGVPVMENIIEFDIGKLVNNCSDMKPNNNIIYVANKNLRLVNAVKLPEGGLTVVSPYNIYLKGNYNTDVNWQPSAVITNSFVYALSEDFNDPQTLPVSNSYPAYPFSLNYQDFLDKYASGPRYPAGLPPYPATGITPTWVKTNLTGGQQATLLYSGESYYSTDNESLMSNRATKNTTYNVAISASISPYPYYLERWTGASVTVQGSFIKLEKGWAGIQDIPSGARDIVQIPSFQYNYESRFSNGQKPAGDFISGSRTYWEETNDFVHGNS